MLYVHLNLLFVPTLSAEATRSTEGDLDRCFSSDKTSRKRPEQSSEISEG